MNTDDTDKHLFDDKSAEDIEQDRLRDCHEEVSHNTLCPCCGVPYDWEPVWGSKGGQMQVCPSCGWESVILYDL